MFNDDNNTEDLDNKLPPYNPARDLLEPDLSEPKPIRRFSSTVCTYGGHNVDLHNPQRDTIFLTDIAWHLSMINRFIGATRFSYSVAQHSLAIAYFAERYICLTERDLGKRNPPRLDRYELDGTSKTYIPLMGLMHDSHEAYLSDIATPVAFHINKRRIDTCKDRMDEAICKRFNMAHDLHNPIIKMLDDAFYLKEKSYLIPRAPFTEEDQLISENITREVLTGDDPHLATVLKEIHELDELRYMEQQEASRQFLYAWDCFHQGFHLDSMLPGKLFGMYRKFNDNRTLIK